MCDPVLCNKEFVCSFHGSWKEISKPLEFPNDSSIFVIHSDIESLCQWVIMVGPQIASAIKMTQNEGKTERHATWLESWGGGKEPGSRSSRGKSSPSCHAGLPGKAASFLFSKWSTLCRPQAPHLWNGTTHLPHQWISSVCMYIISRIAKGYYLTFHCFFLYNNSKT